MFVTLHSTKCIAEIQMEIQTLKQKTFFEATAGVCHSYFIMRNVNESTNTNTNMTKNTNSKT